MAIFVPFGGMMFKGLIESKKVLICCVCIVFLTMLFVFSSITKKGHVVNYAGGIVQGALLTNQGYVRDWDHFTRAGDDSYVTFKHNPEASEFTIFFREPAERDTTVYVWLMDYNGGIKEEFPIIWKEGEYFFRLEDMPKDVSLVSLSIESNFSFYKVISSNPYQRWYKAAKLSLLVGIILVLIILLMIKTGLLDKVTILVKRFLSIFTWKRVVVALSGLGGSFLLACLVMLILNRLGFSIEETRLEINWKTTLVFTAFLFFVHAIIWNRKRLDRKLAFFSGFAILLLGSAYAFLETPITGISWDDQIHYSDAVYYSHLIGCEKNVAEDSMVYGYELNYFDKENNEVVAGMFDKLYSEKYFYEIEDYKWDLRGLVYLPNALGMCLARSFGLPFRWHIYMARFIQALFAALMCIAAMSILKHGQLVIFMMLLTPINVFLFGNISYDPWVTMWTVLGFALVFSERQSDDVYSFKRGSLKESLIDSEEKLLENNKNREKNGWLILILIALSFWLASIVKQVYCVLAIPALFMPSRRFKSKKSAWGFRVLILISMLITFIPMFISRFFFAGSGDSRGGAGVSSYGQIDYIVANPGEYANTLVNFLKEYLNPLCFRGMNSCVELVGYNRVAGVAVPVMILIFVAALVCHGDARHASRKDNKKIREDSEADREDGEENQKIGFWTGSFPIWYRLGMLILYAGVGAICATALYVSFTEVGSDTILGCQGRYLIPVLFPTLYVLTRIALPEKLLDKIRRENFYMLMMIAMAAINLWVLLKEYIVWY